MKKNQNFDLLCDDVIGVILQFLHIKELLKFQRVNKMFYLVSKERVKRIHWDNLFEKIDEQKKNFLLNALLSNKCSYCMLYENRPRHIECSIFEQGCVDKNVDYDTKGVCVCQYYKCWNCNKIVCEYCECKDKEYKGCKRENCKNICCSKNRCWDRWNDDNGYCPKHKKK